MSSAAPAPATAAVERHPELPRRHRRRRTCWSRRRRPGPRVGLRTVVLEAGAGAGAAVREWGHVRLFSPWSELIDPVAEKLLAEAGWASPDPAVVPDRRRVGRALPGAARRRAGVRARTSRSASAPGRRASPAPAVTVWSPSAATRCRSPSTSAGRPGVRTLDRRGRHRRLRHLGHPEPARRRRVPRHRRGRARRPDLLRHPRPRAARGRGAVRRQARRRRRPRRLGPERPRRPGPARPTSPRHPGHLAGAPPRHRRRPSAAATTTSSSSAARWATAPGGRWPTARSRRSPDSAPRGSTVVARTPADAGVDRRADRSTASTRSSSSPASAPTTRGCPRCTSISTASSRRPVALAPEIHPAYHSCGSVSPHGANLLRQPEGDLYLVGMKSYGRAPSFLTLTGYEQTRSVVAEIAGDHESAARVELVLPDTGVCGGSGLFDEVRRRRLLRPDRCGRARADHHRRSGRGGDRGQPVSSGGCCT